MRLVGLVFNAQPFSKEVLAETEVGGRGGGAGWAEGDYTYRYTMTTKITEFRSCVKVEVAVLGSPS